MLMSNGGRYLTLSMLVSLTVLVPLSMVGCDKENEDHGDPAHTLSGAATIQPSSVISSQERDDYPLATCVVSGEPLDAMGGAFVIQHEGREIRFCCRSCVTQFNEAPPKYLAMLDRAAKSGQNTEIEGGGHGGAGRNHDHSGHPH